MTESELVELAARAIHRALCSYRYDLCPHDEPLTKDRAAAQAALAAINLPQMLEEIERLREALQYTRNELSRWGFGDHHYGDTPQEASVVTALAIADAALDPS